MPHPQAKSVSDKSHCQDWHDDKCLTNAQGEGVRHAWNGLSHKLDHISLMLLSSVSVYHYYSNSIFLLQLLLGRLICLNFKTCCFTYCIEEETMSLSVLFYCIWAFFCRCCSFDLSLSCSSPFLLSYGTVSRGGGGNLLWFINEICSSIFALNPKSGQKYFNYMQSPKSAPRKQMNPPSPAIAGSGNPLKSGFECKIPDKYFQNLPLH